MFRSGRKLEPPTGDPGNDSTVLLGTSVLGGDTIAADEHPAAAFGDRFRLLRTLGSGGMSTVYEARDRRRGDLRVALKVPHRTCAEAIYGLKREFRLLSEIRHPNLVA